MSAESGSFVGGCTAANTEPGDDPALFVPVLTASIGARLVRLQFIEMFPYLFRTL